MERRGGEERKEKKYPAIAKEPLRTRDPNVRDIARNVEGRWFIIHKEEILSEGHNILQ